MSRKPVQEWLLIFTYGFILVLITIHSGYLCRKLLFIARQFLPVAIAGILAFVLNHPYKYVQWFYQKKLRWTKKTSKISALLTVYAGVLGVVGAALRYALPRFVSGLQLFIEQREMYIRAFEKSMVSVLNKLGVEQMDLTPIIEGIASYLGRLDEILREFLPQMARITTGVFRLIAVMGIVFVLSAYILYEKEHLKNQVNRLYHAFIPERYAKSVDDFVATSIEVFDNFVVGQGMESLILGGLCFAGMFLLRLEYSGFVSLVVGLTAFVPFLGAYVGGSVGTLLLLFISVKKAVTFLVFFIILQQIENNFIYPRVVGKRIGLSCVFVLAAVTVGGGLFGVAGMILGVPCVTLLYIMIQRAVVYRERQKRLDKK